tara:strand:+ start:70 stop:327 length:258 start_codon:yes stop_codon:yes gene_type:complete
MIDEALLEILACPETKEEVRLVSSSVVEAVNRKITDGLIINRGGVKVAEIIDGGLVRADGKFLYPIREEIPIMLIDEAIPMSDVS